MDYRQLTARAAQDAVWDCKNAVGFYGLAVVCKYLQVCPLARLSAPWP